MPWRGLSGAAGVALAIAPPRRPWPVPAPLLRARVLAVLATERRLVVAALARRVLLAALRVLVLAGRALLAAGVLGMGVASTALAAAAGALLAEETVLGVEPAGVLELAMAGERRGEAVELSRAGRSVSHRAPRNR
jgi:hypothetical protein